MNFPLHKFLAAAVLIAPLSLSGTAQAHHSSAMFEFGKCTTISGTVRKLDWTFPHSWLWVVVPNSNSNEPEITWGFEFMSPVQAMGLDARWKRDAVKVGDKVTVKYAVHREGKPIGAMAGVTLPDGYVLPGSPNICGGPRPGEEAAAKN